MKIFRILAITCILSLQTADKAAFADIAITADERISIYGDARARLETDTQSTDSADDDVNSRTRARIRARLGLKYHPLDWLEFNTRVRTGSSDAQQSANITVYDFNADQGGDWDADFDRWFVKADFEHTAAWIGRNNFPFLKYDEIFWDGDATIIGGLIQHTPPLPQQHHVKLQAGYFSLPAGMHNNSGNMAAADLLYKYDFKNVTLGTNIGYFNLQADRQDSDAGFFNNNNGFRDYKIINSSLIAETQAFDRPLVGVLNWIHNHKNYSQTDPDPITAANHDQTDAYLFSVTSGDTNRRGNWLFGYTFAYVQELAANNSFTNAAWTRYDTTGFRSHLFKVGYGLSDNINILGRTYLTNGINNEEQNIRFRLDLNYKF